MTQALQALGAQILQTRQVEATWPARSRMQP